METGNYHTVGCELDGVMNWGLWEHRDKREQLPEGRKGELHTRAQSGRVNQTLADRSLCQRKGILGQAYSGMVALRDNSAEDCSPLGKAVVGTGQERSCTSRRPYVPS